MAKQQGLFTAADELAQVVGTELAEAFVAHRKALRKPLIPHAAKLIATKLSKMRDPVAAIEKAIEHGWLTVYEEHPSAHQIARPVTGIDALEADLLRRTHDHFNGSASQGTGDHSDLQGLPFMGGEGPQKPH